MRTSIALFVISLVAAATAGRVVAGDDSIRETQLGFRPPAAMRSPEPFVTRIYKQDPATGAILPTQPVGYPFSVAFPHVLKKDETFRTHSLVEFIYVGGGLPAPTSFNAGVHGVVRKAGDGPWRTIVVQTRDGSLIQYLHPAGCRVKVGQIVEPETPLGIIGRYGEQRMYLHLQAKDRAGNVLSPDLVFRLGQQKLDPDDLPATPDASELEFDPDDYCPVKAKLVNGRVGNVWPRQKFASEAIADNGTTELLGEYYDAWSAVRCSAAWREANPESVKRTREREIDIGSLFR